MAKQNNQKMKKDREIPKPSEILEAEEEVKGIVEIGFDEENEPIQNIKEEKKPRHRPNVSQIPTIKPLKNPDLQEMDINDAKIVIEPQSLEDLEEELKDRLKLLEILRREDAKKKQEEEQKNFEEEQRKVQEKILEEQKRQEDERKRIEQELIRKEEQEIEAIKKGTHEISLMSFNEAFLKVCPICSKKIKRKKVKQNGLILTQILKCSNKQCDFQKEIVLHI